MGINATEAPDYFADAPGYATHEVLNQAGALCRLRCLRERQASSPGNEGFRRRLGR